MTDETAIPMSPETAQELVHRALMLWDMTGATYKILRHNENLACQVDGPAGARYLLRICQPKTTALAGIQQDPGAVESEMAWLRAIRRDTGLPVQQPVASVQGRYVEAVAHPEEDRAVPALLLSWIEGEMLTQKEPNAERLLAEVGRTQRRLHEQAKQWTAPQGFHRPQYDEASLLSELPTLERAVKAGIVRPEHYALVERASEHIVECLRSIPKTPDVWGPLHMDWMGNLVIAGDAVVPIDFSLSGMGFYLQDVGQCISNVKKPLRSAYLEGYGVTFDLQEQNLISAYILMIVFITAARNAFNPAWREWIEIRRFPVIAGEFCPRLLAGEPFHLEI